MRCCCGSLACSFLRHNCSLLDNVEKDVHQAARMGQALLARHEAYMAEAERDRKELTSRIEFLEMDNKELEARNARTIEENRDLLDQLEALNTTANDSEGRIKSLEATLLSSQQTIRRLENETARAAALEREIVALEQEQADLQKDLSLSREEARSAVFRWKRAERGINDLSEQLERMEKEAKEEREHHVEMMSRIEKQRDMEKELNTAAGRLKGAAAARSLSPSNGTHVVGHFVRDLLQDNANLQHGIAELREMLMNSHDEIQTLRDQLVYHQPMSDSDTERRAAPTSLRAELETTKEPPPDENKQDTSKASQQLHIHHHYHVANQRQDARKPKKKRLGLSPGVFIPPALSTPHTPSNGFVRQKQLAAHGRKDSWQSNRWSSYSEQPSEFAPSSAPSSPQSSNRRNSVFDQQHLDSFPGSPTTSVDPVSPTWRGHKKRLSNVSTRSFQMSTPFALTPATPAHPIMEESDDLELEPSPELNSSANNSSGDDGSCRECEVAHDEIALGIRGPGPMLSPPGNLRRAVSRESIVSLAGGLDIHTLKSRPSQLTVGLVGSTTSITGSSTVTARPILSRDNKVQSSALLRDSFGPSPVGSLRSVSGYQQPTQNETSRIGKLVGWRPWGSVGANRAATQASAPIKAPSVSKMAKDKENLRTLGRSPGINQPGAIPGFSEYLAASRKKVPVQLTPQTVDEEALMEGLGG
ncbi:hypothetical protein F4780DRAFT_771341 [Xylariomycetidae sp. FL0641]|nr:hypothetical protein F4780DRAFT_771341 [Xylariomycetidae sp. FL0641]